MKWWHVALGIAFVLACLAPFVWRSGQDPGSPTAATSTPKRERTDRADKQVKVQGKTSGGESEVRGLLAFLLLLLPAFLAQIVAIMAIILVGMKVSDIKIKPKDLNDSNWTPTARLSATFGLAVNLVWGHVAAGAAWRITKDESVHFAISISLLVLVLIIVSTRFINGARRIGFSVRASTTVFIISVFLSVATSAGYFLYVVPHLTL